VVSHEWAALSYELKQVPGHIARFHRRVNGGGAKPAYIDLENSLTSWVCAQRERKLIVSISSLKEEAKNIARKLKPSNVIYENFRASCSWVNGYLERNGLSYLTPTHKAQQNNKKPSFKCSDILSYLNHLNRVCFDVALECILNMDETPFYYDIMEKKTVEFKGSNSVDVVHSGSDKARFTVTCTITAWYQRRLTLFKTL
jgi:hypothetical protein